MEQPIDSVEDASHQLEVVVRNETGKEGSRSWETDENREAFVNFIRMSVLFSANHGAMVSCLAFSTLYLGSTGAWELSLFHTVYAASAVCGATYVVKEFGARNSMVLGMGLAASYVACFWFSLLWNFAEKGLAILGALVGGVGGGLVWTAQGSYFSRAANDYANHTGIPSERCTSLLAGYFAFIFLLLEVVCKLLSWILTDLVSASARIIMCVYTIIAVASTWRMMAVQDYPPSITERLASVRYKCTAGWQVLINDPKMRCMIGLNAVFGFASPFVNAYVNGEVVRHVLSNEASVGLLSAMSSAVAALSGLLFGSTYFAESKGTVLVIGAVSFALVTLPFLLVPDLDHWGLAVLIAVYCFQGVGRSSFEGALKGTFADFFPSEKEGAFANIILQNGTFTSIGYLLAYNVPCSSNNGSFCVEFRGGGLHNMLVLELSVICSAFFAILGYWRACVLRKDRGWERVALTPEDDDIMLHDDDLEESAAV